MNKESARGNAQARRKANPPRHRIAPITEMRNATELAKSPKPSEETTCIAAAPASKGNPHHVGETGSFIQRARSLHTIQAITRGTAKPCDISSSVHHWLNIPR